MIRMLDRGERNEFPQEEEGEDGKENVERRRPEPPGDGINDDEPPAHAGTAVDDR